MEKEEQAWEQEEAKEEHEDEETSLRVRESRSVNEPKRTEIDIVDTEGNDGTSESNDHEVLSTVTANPTTELESTRENEERNNEVDGVVGNEEDTSNGLQREDNLVFFDKDEGIWKCRICSWIYWNGSVCVDHMQSHRGQLHKLMNDKTLNNETGGDKFTPITGEQNEKSNGLHKLDFLSQEFIKMDNSISEMNQGSEALLNDDSLSYSNHQHNGIREGAGLSNSYLRSSQISFPEHGPSFKSSEERKSEGVYLPPGDELDLTDIDVEHVLQKQTTHDLYCPNCNSCITRRVILRKRKRSIRLSEQDIKRNKLEALPDSKLDPGSFQASSTVVHRTEYVGIGSAPLLARDHTDHDREPDLFRCLSCFSFFIPTGNGFKLFRIFEEKKVKVNVQNEQVPSAKRNWFASMFAFNKQEPAVEHGTRSPEDVRKTNEEPVPSSNIIDSGQPSVVQEGHPPGQASDNSVGADGKIDNLEGGNEISPLPKQEITVNTKVLVGAVGDKTAEKIEVRLEQSEVYTIDPVLPSICGRPVETYEANPSKKTPLRTHVTSGESSEDGISSSKLEQGRLNLLISSNGESLTVEEPNQIPNQKIQINTGKDAVITIDAHAIGSAGPGQDIFNQEETISASHTASRVTVADSEGNEVRNEFEIEVVKSIVYGGLAESITSLSVVSSAAGGGAGTLNILALGIASLIGGLFVICQNLWELRSNCVEQGVNDVSPVTEQRDRYKELLGRKEHFVLHALVSILSYIIFGLVAPITYGFSFHKSDNKEFKLIVVVAASLLCIVALAIGRAYVRRPPKPYIKLVATFVIMGFMVSGVSYVAGVLVERILEKLGLFHSSSDANLLLPLPLMETVPSYSGLTSY